MRLAWIALPALLIPSLGFAQCQGNYQFNGSGCRAPLKPDFYYGALDTSLPQNLYPICGAGRLPTTGDGSYSVSNFASSGVPRSPHTYTSGFTYSYLKSATAPPVYGYEDASRCVCINRTVPETTLAAGTTFQYLGLVNGKKRILPDTFDVVSSETQSHTAEYGMVAIATDEISDGRKGALFVAGKAKCACPNLNEGPISQDPMAPSDDPIGVRCEPLVQPHPFRVLTTFNPAYHDNGSKSVVMNRTDEPILQATTDQMVTRIALPKSPTEQILLSSYERRIWTCAQPYRLKLVGGVCEYLPEANACDGGDPGQGIPPSEMHPKIPGLSKLEAYENAVNKKLGACLNEYGVAGATVKFDCLDNSWMTFASFNDLWSSTDPAVDGGQPYAIQFLNPAGRPLTGFFKLSGERCDDYSEFAGDIQPGLLSKNNGSWTFTSKGAPIPRAMGTVGADFLNQKVVTMGKRLPTTPAEKAQCPILIRAAIKAICPQNPVLPMAQKTVEFRDASNHLTQRRCSVASGIQVHVRSEQVFEIVDQAPLRVFDTFASEGEAAVISVSQITASKYGSSCPPGTVYQNGVCAY